MKFKKFRPNRAHKAGIMVPPPPKRIKMSVPETPPSTSPSASDTAHYERHVSFLQPSFHSNKWSMASMLTLMEDTAECRRSWIHDENPSVHIILEKFPSLTDPRIVSIFFSKLLVLSRC